MDGRVNHIALKEFVAQVFVKMGVPLEDAQMTADVLVAANLRGIDSHGVARTRRYVQGLLAFCQVDGQHQDTVLYGDGFQRKRTPHMSWLKVGPWGAAVNPATGRAVVMVGASGERRMELSDWGVDGGHLMFYNHIVLVPRGSHAMVAYLALAESLEEAKRYGSLATWADD